MKKYDELYYIVEVCRDSFKIGFKSAIELEVPYIRLLNEVFDVSVIPEDTCEENIKKNEFKTREEAKEFIADYLTLPYKKVKKASV